MKIEGRPYKGGGCLRTGGGLKANSDVRKHCQIGKIYDNLKIALITTNYSANNNE